MDKGLIKIIKYPNFQIQFMKKSILTLLASVFAFLCYAQLGIGTTSPNSTLDVRGSIATSYRAFTANTAATATDNLLAFTGTTAATITLPTAVGCDGRTYMIKNASTTGPTPVLSIATTSSQTIDGAASWSLTSANETVTLISNGANWNVSAQSLPGGSGVNWTQNGNSVASQKSIGTISNYSLPFITNNTEKMRLTNTGSLGIGTSTFNATNPEKLVVDAGTTTSVNAIVGKGSIDNYLQLNIQNNSTGTNASSDVVATANNGSETTNFVDMGINGGSNTSGIMGAANDAYLYNIGQNLLMGTGTATKSLVFLTGGTTQSTNERMRIDGTGDVGIGTSTIPKAAVGSAKLAIDGTTTSLNGPHVQYTTSADNYPVLQNLNWAHDFVYNAYDAYFDGTWKSGTTSGGNFVMGKELGKFVLQYGTDNTPGTTIPWNNGIVLTNTGTMGIGTQTFNATNPEKLVVDAGVTSSVNAIVGKGSIDNYLQLNIQNNSAGTNASSDVVATANNGSETTNFIDMGINGGGNASGTMGTANDAYLYNIGQNLLLGTGTAAKSLVFMTGGTTQSTSERMRIDGSGNVGIGITNPTYKLQVNAGSNPLFLGGVQTGAGTDSLLTIINGVVKKIHTSALPGSGGWLLTGNASTNPSTNFIGTTDAQALVIKENNTQVGRFDASSIAFGNGATINSSANSYVIGSSAVVGFNKIHAYAFGSGATVNADSSFSIGIGAVSNGANSLAIGNGAAANNYNSIALGRNAVTAYTITDAIAIGTNATANFSNAIAIGSNTTAASKTIGNAASAIALGNAAVSNSTNAIAIGTGATTGFSLTNPVAIGVSTSVNGSNGVALGNGASISFISNATAIGAGASVSNTGNNSTAIGYNASATLANEIILGDRSNSALSVGIGTESFSGTNREKLLVDAGTTTSVNAIVGRGSIDRYLQLNIQNNTAGTSASSDVVATANNGNETSNYVDMGINGGNYTGGIMGAANDGYLYTMGNNFLLGTGNASKSLVFMTGGTSQATNERMRIDGNGNVGIGTTAPAVALHVVKSNSGGNVLALQNTSATGYSSADFYSSSNVLSGTFGYGNGSTGAPFTGRDYFNTYGNDFILANGVSSPLFVQGSTSNVGVNNTSPSEKLDITGNIKFSGALMPGGSAGTAGQLLISAGAGAAPTWSDLSGSAWIINGNNVPSVKSIGTTSAFDLPFITNNTEKMRLSSSGNLGVGTSTFNATNPEKLVVDAGTTTSVNAIVGKGSIDNYLQLNIQNNSAGASASSDVVATANNGSETTNYIDMGINGGSNTSGVMGAANDGYLYNIGQNLLVGTGTAAKSLIFMTGGTTQSTNERMRITGSGLVGIGNNNPTSTLSVTGSSAYSITTKTVTYTATANDYSIVCNNSGAITINLPAASGATGRVYVIKKISAGGNNVTVDPNASETIDGAATRVLTTQYESVVIQCDGTSWYILSKN